MRLEIKKATCKITVNLIVFLLASSGLIAQPIKDTGNLPKLLKVEKKRIESLFNQKTDQVVALPFKTSNGSAILLDIVVKNHINKGETSGAIAATFTGSSMNGRLLLSRKPLKGEMTYWISLLPEKCDDAYFYQGALAETITILKVKQTDVVNE